MIESNAMLYEKRTKKIHFLGEGDISWYAYEYDNGYFVELDNQLGRIMKIIKD